MTRHLGCKDAAVLAGCLLVISGCTGGAVQRAAHQDAAMRSGPVRLTSFHGCGEELAALRQAAEASVGPYGLPGQASPMNGTAYPAAAAGASRAAAGAGAAAAAPAAVPAYSGTNDYVAGVDEPDLVKTDGRRIVTVAGGVLEVIDAASRTVTGRLELSAAGEGIAFQPANLLLSGDHALVLTSGGPVAAPDRSCRASVGDVVLHHPGPPHRRAADRTGRPGRDQLTAPPELPCAAREHI